MWPQSSCPKCGNRLLPEFSDPSGVALCARCGNLLRRTSDGFVLLGIESAELATILRKRSADASFEAMRERLIDLIAEQKGVDLQEARRRLEKFDLDSLDAVELVMAVEEEFGISIDDDANPPSN